MGPADITFGSNFRDLQKGGNQKGPLKALSFLKRSYDHAQVAPHIAVTERLLLADCVEEVGELSVRDISKKQARGPLWSSSGLQGRRQDQLCQLSEVLGGGSQEELVPSTKGASQPEAIEAQDALQVREQHLDLLTFTPRPYIGIGLRDVARDVSGLFVD